MIHSHRKRFTKCYLCVRHKFNTTHSLPLSLLYPFMLLNDNHLSMEIMGVKISFKRMARSVILATNLVVLVEVFLHPVILKHGVSYVTGLDILYLVAINGIILSSCHHILVAVHKLISPLINNNKHLP